MTPNNQLLCQITKNMLAVNPIARHVALRDSTVSIDQMHMWRGAFNMSGVAQAIAMLSLVQNKS